MEDPKAWSVLFDLFEECDRRLFELLNATEVRWTGSGEGDWEDPEGEDPSGSERAALAVARSEIPDDVDVALSWTPGPDGDPVPVVLLAVRGALSEAFLLSPEGLPVASLVPTEGCVRFKLLDVAPGQSFVVRLDRRPPLRFAVLALPRPRDADALGVAPDLELAAESLAHGQPLLARDRVRAYAERIDALALAACARRAECALEALHEQRAAALAEAEVPARLGLAQVVVPWRGRPSFAFVSSILSMLAGGTEAAGLLEEGSRLANEELGLFPDDDYEHDDDDHHHHDLSDFGLDLEIDLELAYLSAFPFDGVQSEGHGILRMAAALVTASCRKERGIPADLFVAASLGPGGKVQPLRVSLFRRLAEAVAREWPGARVLVARSVAEECSPPQGVTFVPVDSLVDALDRALSEQRRRLSDTTLLNAASRLEREYRHEESLARARDFLARGDSTLDQRLRALRLVGTNLVHLGRPEEAVEPLAGAYRIAEELEKKDGLRAATMVLLGLARADGLTDAFDYSEALAVLERTRRYAKSPVFRAKVSGFQGYVLLHAFRSEEAALHLRHALATPERADLPRYHCWLARAEADAGRYKDALERADLGLRIAAELGGDAEAANAAYLCLLQARLHLENQTPARAEEAATRGLALVQNHDALTVHPGALLLRALGEAQIAQGDVPRGLETLNRCGLPEPASPFLRLISGLGRLAAIRHELARDPDNRLYEAHITTVQTLVSSYPPAAHRFQAQLAGLRHGRDEAIRSIESILETLRY